MAVLSCDVDATRAGLLWCHLRIKNNFKLRLKKRFEFLYLQRFGLRYKTLNVVLIFGPFKTQGRVGFTVSKKIGKAHTRNFVKRRFRHIIHSYPFVHKNHDLVVLPLVKSVTSSFDELRRDVLYAYKRIRSRSGS